MQSKAETTKKKKKNKRHPSVDDEFKSFLASEKRQNTSHSNFNVTSKQNAFF